VQRRSRYAVFDAESDSHPVGWRRELSIHRQQPRPGEYDVRRFEFDSPSAIESIEILKDGASTTYGADAVAGVVNLKMLSHYDGGGGENPYGNTLD